MTPDSFAAFWQLFPRRVAKKAAEKAWARVASSPEAIEQIMAGLREQLPNMITKDKSFIPHASTWLNGERWKDDHIAPKHGFVLHRQTQAKCIGCADTGVIITASAGARYLQREACACPAGELPGLALGPIDPRDIGQLPGVLAGVAE